MTLLAVSVMAERIEQLRERMLRAFAEGAELVELRLDSLSQVTPADLPVLLADRPGPVIATCRPIDEGGHFAGSEQERISLLIAAGLAGAEWIDCEYAAWSRSANIRQKIGLAAEVNRDSTRQRARLICSTHDPRGTPDELSPIVDRLAATGAHAIKLASTAKRATDGLRMMDELRRIGGRQPMIGLAMGEAGLITRVLSRKCGAWLTFASLEPGQESAPGQIDLHTLRNLYRWDAIDDSTAVYGVVGDPVSQSLGPRLHNAAFARLGWNAVYLPLCVEPGLEALSEFVTACLQRDWLGLGGLSITQPHKRNAFELPGIQLDPLAEPIGAVNTLVVEGGLQGYNTDGIGVADALIVALGGKREALNGLEVTLLGAGGTARAVLAVLVDHGCRVTVYNRDRRRGEQLAAAFGAMAKPWGQRDRHDGQVIINTTSVGMAPAANESPMPVAGLRGGSIVFDCVYRPTITRLLADAEHQGCTIITGLELFLRQAGEQLRLWTGRSFDVEELRTMLGDEAGA